LVGFFLAYVCVIVNSGYHNTQTQRKNMADNNKTPYELRWEILKEMINLTRDEWHHKRELAQYNAEKSGKSLEYGGDIPLHDALQRAENVYASFICKK